MRCGKSTFQGCGGTLWTLRHVAHVAQIAFVDDFSEIPPVDAIQFAGLALIDQIEQRRERGAKIDAAAATVTDVEDAMHLGMHLSSS